MRKTVAPRSERCRQGQAGVSLVKVSRPKPTRAALPALKPENQSRQRVQVADLLGYVQVPSTKTVGLNGPPGQVRLM